MVNYLLVMVLYVAMFWLGAIGTTLTCGQLIRARGWAEPFYLLLATIFASSMAIGLVSALNATANALGVAG